jgi:hypothetical protein
MASHRGGPGSRTGLVKWDLWWTKWRWGRFSPSTSVSPANLHSTNYSTITLIYHMGLYNRPEVAAVPGDVSPTPQKTNYSEELNLNLSGNNLHHDGLRSCCIVYSLFILSRIWHYLFHYCYCLVYSMVIFININLFNCSSNCVCIVFIVCSVPFIVCVVLCAVFCLSVVCYFVWCVLFVCCVLL